MKAVLVATLLALGLCVASYADTYNFLFEKKSKKKSEEKAVTGEETSQDVPAQAPIIINNHNNNDSNNRNSTPALSAPAVGESSSSDSDEVVAEVPRPKQKIEHWNFTLSGVSLYSPAHGPVQGGMVSVGYSERRSLEWRVFLGGTYGLPFAGADVEVVPLRITLADTWDLFRLGFFVGNSTLPNEERMPGSFHLGARAGLHLGPSFGVTASVRSSLGYFMGELGLTGSF